MFARIHLAVTALILSICAAPAYSQSTVAQNSLRARLPFSGANEPASLQSAMKSRPRPSTGGGWSPQRIWGYGQTPAVTYYRPRAPWLPTANSIAPTGTVDDNWSWMDSWESDQLVRDSAVDESTRAVLDVMSTQPNPPPWLDQNSESQISNYATGYQLTPPVASAAAASTQSSGASDTAPSQPLSVPSAATSAPIPY
jgi:hypothetical protein